jgi:putative hydrolase of HD superfamily
MKNIANFIFEINNLKRFEHCGTKFAGVKNPDSIAEHVFRTMQIAYIIAGLEGVTESELLKVLEITLFHDNAEVRVGDIHKIASKYIDYKEGENKAFEDQIKQLPEVIQKRLSGIVKKYNDRDSSIEYVISKDADLLETMFQAKEYLELGYKTQRWIDNAEKYLVTKSAKKMLAQMKKNSFVDWWSNLNKA